MKKILIFFAFCLFISAKAYTQVYYVTLVKPTGQAQANGKVINLRDTLLPNDQISLESASVYLKVRDRSYESFKIAGNGKLSNIIRSNKNKQNYGTKGYRGFIQSLEDLIKFFSTEKLLIIKGYGLQLSIVPEIFVLKPWENPVTDAQFLYIQYSYQGELINKALKVGENNSFVLDESIFTIDGAPINPEDASNFVLFYKKTSDGVVDRIGTIQLDLEFINPDELKQEMQSILADLPKEISYDKIVRQRMEPYFEKQGCMYFEYLRGWIKDEMGLTFAD